MDIDPIYDEPSGLGAYEAAATGGAATTRSGQGRRRTTVTAPVDDAHPFDLDAYIAQYTGRTAVDRLMHIIHTLPAIAPEAFQLGVQLVHQGRDPSLYQGLLSAYEQAVLNLGAASTLPNPLSLATLDTRWVDKTNERNRAEQSKLELELKTYSGNMIKESIRMAHRDLANHFRQTGDYASALKHYTKSREFCATSGNVLEMCMSILELLIEQRNYSHLTTYVFKADAALDAARAASGGGGAPGAPKRKATLSPETQDIQARLDLASALSCMGQESYQQAAEHFLKACEGGISALGPWIGKLISPSDITVYTTLCALATFPRASIKAKLLESASFTMFIEQEGYVRDLIQAYLNSNFRVVLELLDRHSTRHHADIHLHMHINSLYTKITNWAIILYFQPFASIRLERMSEAFGWSVEEVERRVVALIQEGKISGRVDRMNKILQAKKTDHRAELFARAIKAGTDVQSTNRKLLLRMRLQKADLVIKPPKGREPGMSMMSELMAGGD